MTKHDSEAGKVDRQPRSHGSLPPALRSDRACSVGRVGENPGNEVGWPGDRVTLPVKFACKPELTWTRLVG